MMAGPRAPGQRIVLAQVPEAHEWLGVAIVVAVNVLVTVRGSGPRGAVAA